MSAVIRLASSADATGLARLIADFDSSASVMPSFSDGLAQWMSDRADTHICAVAELDGRLVGMAWLAIQDRVPRPDRLDRRSGDIQSVYVDPAVRRQGIAGALMRLLGDVAREHHLDFESVHSSTAGLPLYRADGFEPDPQLMRKRLRPRRAWAPR